MRIGIVSDSESMIPLAYTLAAHRLQVYLYYAPSGDPFVRGQMQHFATQSGLPLQEEQNHERDLYTWLNTTAPDVCFVIGYKHLIHLNKLKLPVQLFNIHFGPLPAFKGPFPVFWQLKQGVKNLGLSIHRLSEKWDEGEVVWTKELPDQPHYTCRLVTQLMSQACVEGALLIVQFLSNGMTVPAIDRSHITPSYHKRPGLDDVLIRWNEMDAQAICNLVRACNSWNKGAINLYKNQEVKLMDAEILKPSSEPLYPAGTLTDCNKNFIIQCRDGYQLKVNMLFFKENYLPTYHASKWGFQKNNLFSEKSEL